MFSEMLIEHLIPWRPMGTGRTQDTVSTHFLCQPVRSLSFQPFRTSHPYPHPHPHSVPSVLLLGWELQPQVQGSSSVFLPRPCSISPAAVFALSPFNPTPAGCYRFQPGLQMQNLAQRELSILSEVPLIWTSQTVGAWVCRVTKGEMVEGEGVERRGAGKVKEDEGVVGVGM